MRAALGDKSTPPQDPTRGPEGIRVDHPGLTIVPEDGPDGNGFVGLGTGFEDEAGGDTTAIPLFVDEEVAWFGYWGGWGDHGVLLGGW